MPNNMTELQTTRYKFLAEKLISMGVLGDNKIITMLDYVHPNNVRIFFNQNATAEQRTQVQNFIDSWDWTESGYLTQLRDQAENLIQSNQEQTTLALKGVVLEVLNYANQQREKFNLLLQWLSTQTTLVNRNQLNGQQLPLATYAQAEQAIIDRIKQGQAG